MLTARSISSPNTRRCTPRRLTACHRRRRACLKIRHGLFYIKPFYTRASTLIIKHKEFYLQKKLRKNFADLNTCRTFAIANTKATINGAVVQLVRIHACHAWGRGFESRPHRRNPETKVSGFFVFVASPHPSNIRFCGNLQKSAEQPSKQRDAPPGKSTTYGSRHPDSTAIGEVHNVDPLSVNFYLCTINRKLRETLRIVKKKDRDGELLC